MNSYLVQTMKDNYAKNQYIFQYTTLINKDRLDFLVKEFKSSTTYFADIYSDKDLSKWTIEFFSMMVNLPTTLKRIMYLEL